jgi:hypothetical protein
MKNELLNRTKSKPSSSHIPGRDGVSLPKQPQSSVRSLARAESRAEEKPMEMNAIARAREHEQKTASDLKYQQARRERVDQRSRQDCELSDSIRKRERIAKAYPPLHK